MGFDVYSRAPQSDAVFISVNSGMTEQPRTLRALRELSEALREAIAESKLAYELNTYSYSCLSACLAAERALDAPRAAIEGIK
jgi:hypothetical protein